MLYEFITIGLLQNCFDYYKFLLNKAKSDTTSILNSIGRKKRK